MRISNKNILSDIIPIFEEKIKNGRGKKICLQISEIFDNSYYMNNIEINIIWDVPLESICICKRNGKKLILKKDDIISFHHCDSFVKITKFTGYKDDPGPMGLEYLPWMGNRWATPRHIIAYPTGIQHYGEHINWYSIRLLKDI